ncbi:MAG: 5-formyltetrahydrofolate cyclo-ligase [Kiritimatiellae bacterium]|nr:5-formyltetrahydrofolate cyclo-ligase [Kiritimatiellia bacterium]
MNSTHEQKQALRREIRARRRALDPAWVAEASGRIQQAVLGLDAFRQARAVGGYLSLPHEVQTAGLIAACWAANKRVAVPVFDHRRKLYSWGWHEPQGETQHRRWRIAEPLRIRPAAGREIDLILVPAVAVDRAGRRLGHGGGYYDRMLAETRALRVAVVFDFQVLEAVPARSHDSIMDVIVTENGVTAISRDPAKKSETDK